MSLMLGHQIINQSKIHILPFQVRVKREEFDRCTNLHRVLPTSNGTSQATPLNSVTFPQSQRPRMTKKHQHKENYAVFSNQDELLGLFALDGCLGGGEKARPRTAPAKFTALSMALSTAWCTVVAGSLSFLSAHPPRSSAMSPSPAPLALLVSSTVV